MKRYIALLLSVLLIAALCPTLFLTSASEDPTNLYFNDFDTAYDASEWTVAAPSNANYTYTVTRETDSGTGNGYLSAVITSGSESTVRFVNLSKEIKVSEQLSGAKPKLLLEYRYRVAGNKNGSYMLQSADPTDATYSEHCYVSFVSTENAAYADNNKTQKLADVTVGEWNTVTVLYDNEANKRTVYVNGGAGTEIEDGNAYAESGVFKVGFKAAINITNNKYLDFDYMRIQAVPENFEYTLSNVTAESADVTFSTMPNPTTVTADAFTVGDIPVASVERKPALSNTYTLTFGETLIAGNHTLAATGVTSAAGVALTTAEQPIIIAGGATPAPEYSISYLYNYDFDTNLMPDSSYQAGTGGATITQQVSDDEGNVVLRMTGADKTSLSEVGRSYQPKLLLNAGTVAGNPNVILEFRYRTDGFADSFESLRYRTGSSFEDSSPAVVLNNDSVHSIVRDSGEDVSKMLAVAENGKWHTVSIIYNGTERSRTVVVDGVMTSKTPITEGNDTTAGDSYGTGTDTAEFNLHLYGYFLKATSIDFDYIRAYTYPEFTLQLPKETGVPTAGIDVDFSYFPNLSTLNADNIQVKERGTETVVTTAGNPRPNGVERQYYLNFADALTPNTKYDISFNVQDIDGRTVEITCPFETADPALYIGELTIDDSSLSAVKATISSVNDGVAGKDAVLMIGAFANEEGAEHMKAFKSVQVDFARTTVYETETIDISGLTGEVVLKAFLWTGTNRMTPLKGIVSKALTLAI